MRKRQITRLIVVGFVVALIALSILQTSREPSPLLQTGTKVTALSKDEWGVWINSHTLVLVRTVNNASNQGEFHYEDWVSRADILDTLTGKRVPSSGLTRMLNRLGGGNHEPIECEPSPDGKWLLWTVVAGIDNYPSFYMSTPDGTQYYEWPAGKFDTRHWINAHIWLVREHEDSSLPLVVRAYDANNPLHPRVFRADKIGAQGFIRDQATWNSVFELDDIQKQIGHQMIISEYKAEDYYLSASPRAVSTYRLPAPGGLTVDELHVSPDHSRLLFAFSGRSTAPSGRSTLLKKSLWSCRLDGTHMHKIWYLEFKDPVTFKNYEWSGLQWLSDSIHISFNDDKYNYLLSSE